MTQLCMCVCVCARGSSLLDIDGGLGNAAMAAGGGVIHTALT